ncbi:CidA/LrgA family protein [Cohnella endophytica]|uniref:CidA/LrgA family protein n=1 Tax=Cohnella endophytica TaxID=2419778 RepID=A0A494XY19_9BACL|nr:CidA/LrgA family protein [Cohnella endophytica]RKP52984.1 CidA/LrgA family protein [Cohnella endophytica]
MLGLAILLGYELIGYVFHQFLGVPLPANVIGLILLFVSLMRGWVKLEWIEQPARFLLKHMMIFFAPTIVGVLVFADRIGEEWAAISISLVGSTIVVLLLTGWTTTWLAKERQRDDIA